MTDARLDRELDRAERGFARADARREKAQLGLATDGAPRRGRLSAEEAAARKEAQTGVSVPREGAARTGVSVPRARAVPADAARTMRLGFFAALALVMILLWIRQKRKAST